MECPRSTTGRLAVPATHLVERPPGVGDRRRGSGHPLVPAADAVAQQPDADAGAGSCRPATCSIIQRDRRHDALRSSTAVEAVGLAAVQHQHQPGGGPRRRGGSGTGRHGADIGAGMGRSSAQVTVVRPDRRVGWVPPVRVAVGATRQDGPMATETPETSGDAQVEAAPPEAREEHRDLSEQVEDARWRYYVLDDPTLSDADFDRRMRRLEELEDAVPRAAHARLADAEGRRRGVDRVHRRGPPRADDEPRQRLLLRGARDLAGPAGPRRRRGRRRCSASSRSTGSRSTCSTRTAGWSAPPPGATAAPARTSPPTCARSTTSRTG